VVIHGPAFGGAHNEALRLDRPLAERGVESLVVLPEEAGAAAARLRAEGVQVLTMPLHRLRATPDPRIQGAFVASLRREVGALRGLIRERGIDVVQVHGCTNPQGALAARAEGRAVLWYLFDTRAPMAIRRLAMPLVVRLSDAIMSTGNAVARMHPGAESVGQRLVLVYPPVSARELAPDPGARRSARAELGVEQEAPLVGSIGVLNPQKGHEHLIRAAAVIADRRPDVRFRVLGGPSPAHAAYERRLRREVARRGLSERFQFVDPGNRVPALVHAFDVVALASVPRSEGIPTVVLEAMAAEKPVVATRVGAVPEVVDEAATGIIVEPRRPEALASALLRLLEDRELRESMGAAGRRKVLERFDLEHLADLRLRALELALAHSRERR